MLLKESLDKRKCICMFDLHICNIYLDVEDVNGKKIFYHHPARHYHARIEDLI